MPTFPVYNSSKNIQPMLAEPVRDEAAQPFQDQQKVLGAVQDVTQKWSDAHDVMQFTEAKAKHEIAVADIEARANADPDFKNSKKYIDELNTAKQNSLMGIDNKGVANKAAMEFDLSNQISGIKINSDFNQKQIKFNKVMASTSLDALLKKKLAAPTPAAANQFQKEIDELLQANIKSGTLSYAEADKMLKDSQKTTVQYEIYNDPSTQEKDSALLKELRDPKGKYSYLDSDTRLSLIEESQRRIFQNNQTFKRDAEISRDGRFTNIFTKANEGTLTLSDLDAEMNVPEKNGGIPQKQLLDIRKSIQSRIKNDLETITENNDKAAEYTQFIDNFVSDETDRQKGREAIVNAYKDGILSPKEAAFLNSLKRETEDIKWNREMMTNNLIPFKNAITAVGEVIRGRKTATEKDAALAIKKLLAGGIEGKNPADLANQVLFEDAVSRNPNILTIPEGGQLHIDADGTLKILFKDGTYKDPSMKTSTQKETSK